MTIFFVTVNLLLIAFIARRLWLKVATSDSRVYWSAFTFKLGAGILVGLLYKYYYNGAGDTFAFFDDAIRFVEGYADQVTNEPRSLFFVRIVAGINQLTGNNYWLTSLWFSLFSFLCSYRVVVQLDQFFPSLGIPSRVALLFMPSVVFWSSGIVKESLAFGAVLILVVYFIALMYGEKITVKLVVEIILSLILLLNLKYYWAAVLLPSMITALIEKRIAPMKFVAVWYVIIFVLLCVAVSFTHPNFYLSRFLSVIVENHDTYATYSRLENLIEYYDLSASWMSIIINSPWALWSGLFRPLVFEIPTLPGFLAGVENLFLLVLVVWKLRSFRMPSIDNRLVVFAAVMYIVVLCVFLALSTPNLGTLSRYRVGFLSFFVLLILADHPILKFFNGKSSHHIRS